MNPADWAPFVAFVEAQVLAFLVGALVGRFGARVERSLRRHWRRLRLGVTRRTL